MLATKPAIADVSRPDSLFWTRPLSRSPADLAEAVEIMRAVLNPILRELVEFRRHAADMELRLAELEAPGSGGRAA
jgi:hypothetical protein